MEILLLGIGSIDKSPYHQAYKAILRKLNHALTNPKITQFLHNHKRRNTVALKGLIVLEDPAFVNQPLLIRRYVALLGQNILEQTDSRFDGNLNGKFRTVGATDVEGDSLTAVGFGSVVRSTITSHTLPTLPNFSKIMEKTKKKKSYRSMRERLETLTLARSGFDVGRLNR